MKRIFTLCTAFLTLMCVNAAERRVATADELALYKKSTTYVVNSNDNIILDASLAEAVKKGWTATPYKIIDMTEFNTLKVDGNNSFLMITKVVDTKDKLKRPYLYLSLVMGNKDAAKDLDLMPEVAFVPFATQSADGSETSSTVMLEPMVKFVQKHATNKMENPYFIQRIWGGFNNRLQIYNNNTSQLKDKTIYVNKADIDASINIQDASRMTGGKVKFVEEDDIASAISNNEANAVVAFTVFPQGTEKGAYAYKMVLGIDGTMYYYDYATNPKSFLFQKSDADKVRSSAK